MTFEENCARIKSMKITALRDIFMDSRNIKNATDIDVKELNKLLFNEEPLMNTFRNN